MKDYQLQLAGLFLEWTDTRADEMQQLAAAGSDRRYFRLRGAGTSAIGCFNADYKENNAFLRFSRHFRAINLAVPEIYAERLDSGIYLQQDLGDTSLYQCLPRPGEVVSPQTEQYLQQTLRCLAEIQILGGKGLDYSVAYPRAAFDAQSMLWDLHYCKHYFLKLSGLPFDEQALEDSFQALIQHLLLADTQHFMYRDFQSRNIMIHNEKPWCIDYQGGRRGALQYDVASMLYQARAGFTEAHREKLLASYLDHASDVDKNFNTEQFLTYWPGYILIRMLQTLGAYGFRGLFERKPLFRYSLEAAVTQLGQFLGQEKMPAGTEELHRLLCAIVDSGKYNDQKISGAESKLTVTIKSFSYPRRGYPTDASGNGGGFAFDCRFIDNPGRIDAYKPQSGLDVPVQQYLERETVMPVFLEQVWSIVDTAVEKYLQRGFTDLQINFGCTGGQHRSVYAAERTAAHLRDKYAVRVEIQHLEAQNWVV